jgi:hypothetical protein
MKIIFLHFAILILASHFNITAQQEELINKNKPMTRNKLGLHQNQVDRKINANEKPLINSDLYNPSGISDLTEFKKFPYQAPNKNYFTEFTPITLSGDSLMMFWAVSDDINFTKDDTLFLAISADKGETWENKKIVKNFHYGSLWYITAKKTNTGRIIVFWASGYKEPIKYIYSDDNCTTWSPVISLQSSQYIYVLLSISQAADNSLYLSYSRDINGNYIDHDIVFRRSTDDGLTWSEEKIISNDLSYQYMCNIIDDSANKLLAIYTRDGKVVKRESTDEGNSWSSEVAILDDSDAYEHNARIVRINNDSLCAIYMHNDWPKVDLYYCFSGDNGNTWSAPSQFTHFAGYEGYPPGVCLFNNKPFIVFLSERWQSLYQVQQAWYGIIGITEDNNPPPTVHPNAAYQYYFAPGREETILGNILGESGVQNALVNISLNGGTEYSLEMFDDGEHNDWGTGDGIYGIPVGSFALGDHLEYSFSVTDINGNVINVEGFTIDVLQHGNPINPNKGFEDTPVGMTGGDISGWILDLNQPAQAWFEVVNDTIKEGNHALKIEATNLGQYDWDIQAINQPFPVEPNVPYRYLIWAKADKENTFVDFTARDFSNNEWLSAYKIPLTTRWQEYSFDFFTTSDASTGRAANFFSLKANSSKMPIKFYIDDLRIMKVGSTVDVNEGTTEGPEEFSLSQNYPNPFNPSTVISYQLAAGSQVTLIIYDIIGNEVATLVNEEKPVGTYKVEFTGHSDECQNLSSGVYFYQLKAGDFVETKKLILLR